LKKNKSMKYILIGVSTKYDDGMLVNDLIGKLATKFNVERLNHSYGNGMCVMVFETKLNFGKLKLSISEVMNKECPMYFLYKHDTKSSLTSLPDSYQGILDLDNNQIEGINMSNRSSELNSLMDLLNQINSGSDQFEVFNLFELEEKPTLDEILDKICESGYNSLSLSEKEFLSDYSKKIN